MTESEHSSTAKLSVGRGMAPALPWLASNVSLDWREKKSGKEPCVLGREVLVSIHRRRSSLLPFALPAAWPLQKSRSLDGCRRRKCGAPRTSSVLQWAQAGRRARGWTAGDPDHFWARLEGTIFFVLCHCLHLNSSTICSLCHHQSSASFLSCLNLLVAGYWLNFFKFHPFSLVIIVPCKFHC
jgi:hypothetical protein